MYFTGKVDTLLFINAQSIQTVLNLNTPEPSPEHDYCALENERALLKETAAIMNQVRIIGWLCQIGIEGKDSLSQDLSYYMILLTVACKALVFSIKSNSCVIE